MSHVLILLSFYLLWSGRLRLGSFCLLPQPHLESSFPLELGFNLRFDSITRTNLFTTVADTGSGFLKDILQMTLQSLGTVKVIN